MTLINGCIHLPSTCGSVVRDLVRTSTRGSHGLGLSLLLSSSVSRRGIDRGLTNCSNVLVTPNFNRHNISNGVLTTHCTHRGGVAYLNVYFNVRVVTVRFTHGMLNCGSTRATRVGRSAPRAVVSVLRRRGAILRGNNSVHLNTCTYGLSPGSRITRVCKGRRVSRHRHRHFRFGGACGTRFRTGNVGVSKAGPSAGLNRVVRLAARP